VLLTHRASTPSARLAEDLHMGQVQGDGEVAQTRIHANDAAACGHGVKHLRQRHARPHIGVPSQVVRNAGDQGQLGVVGLGQRNAKTLGHQPLGQGHPARLRPLVVCAGGAVGQDHAALRLAGLGLQTVHRCALALKA
jgi:hypothetical protein